MKLLRKMIQEDAAAAPAGGAASAAPAATTSTAAVAGVRQPLLGGTKGGKSSKASKKTPIIKRSLSESLLNKLLKEGPDGKYSPEDVISKLSAAEKNSEFNRNSVPFGLEDDNGHVVKVYVKPEEAEDFEKALGAIINDKATSESEIAEILFNLKDKFDIVHVEWPQVQEDEEENVELKGDQQGQQGQGDQQQGQDGQQQGQDGQDDMQLPDKDGDDDQMTPDSSGDDGVKGALDKVIDMLKADAEARKAEADAKRKEAEAEEAKFAAQLADQKVKSEEEVLDMESFYKKKNEEKKEAQKLAKLAKYRHEMAGKAEDELGKDSIEHYDDDSAEDRASKQPDRPRRESRDEEEEVSYRPRFSHIYTGDKGNY